MLDKKEIHLDRNGNVIHDLSKVKVPIELQRKMFYIINPHIKWEETK